jgi:hypothetical protein
MADKPSVWSRFVAHIASDDPIVAASNTIAMVVAGNQPFYPLYVWWIVGDDHWTSLVTFLSTPFFVAVPAVARRWPGAGKALLPLTGIGNTFLCAKAFGEASTVELFLLPCVIIAAMSFRRDERSWAIGVIAVAVVGFLALHGRYGAPLHVFSKDEYASFTSMNAISVACLTVLVIYKFIVARRALAP